MSTKDFRAKQIRTNKIIGRSEGAIPGTGDKVQMALMKSGSADFAGGLTDATGGGTEGLDVGRIKSVATSTDDGLKIGEDVWLVVDGNSSKKYTRSPGESVLFLGDVVVSGTLYTERMRTVIHTHQLTTDTDHSFVTSGSIFVNERSGISVGKTVVYPDTSDDIMTDPRGATAADLASSIFWAGNNQGTNAHDYDTDESNPDPLLVIRPSMSDNDANNNNRGRIGIGTNTPGAKLEIMAPTFGTDPSAAPAHLKLRNSTNSDDDSATFHLTDAGRLIIATKDHNASTGHIMLHADGAVDLRSNTGHFRYKDIVDVEIGRFQLTGDDLEWKAFDGGSAETLFSLVKTRYNLAAGAAGDASFRMASTKKIEFTDETVFMHAHAAGKLTIDAGGSGADAIVIGASNAAGGIDIDAGSNGISVESTGGDISVGTTLAVSKKLELGNASSTQILLTPLATAESANASKILIKNSLGDTEAGSGDAAILIQAASGGITLDAQKDIQFDAAGKDVIISSQGKRHFHFDGSNTALKIYDDRLGLVENPDYFQIQVDDFGQTEITTNDSTGDPAGSNNGAHLWLSPDGVLRLNPQLGVVQFYANEDARADDQNSRYIDFHMTGADMHIRDGNQAVLYSLMNVQRDVGAEHARSIRVDTNKKIEFRDAATFIHSTGGNILNITAPTLDVDSTTVDVTSATTINLGAATSEVTVGQNLTVEGNLTVKGTTTQINTAQLLVEDRVIQLSKGDATDADVNQGFIFTRATANLGGNSDKSHGALYFQGSDNSGNGLFVLGVTADDGTDVFTAGGPEDDDLSDLKIGKLLIDGTTNHIDAPGDLVITAESDVTFTVGGGNVTPTANGGAALGSDAKSWSNLFLGTGAVVDFKAGDVTLTHVDTVGLLLNSGKQLQFGHADENISGDGTDLTIASSGKVVVNSTSNYFQRNNSHVPIKLKRLDSLTNTEVIGRIEWAGTATEEVTSARIEARSEGTWSKSIPMGGLPEYQAATSLRFSTWGGTRQDFNNPPERMIIASNGMVGIGVSNPDAQLEVLSTSSQQKWSYDPDSFAAITVADNSHTTLATGQSGNFILDANGDFTVDSEGTIKLDALDGHFEFETNGSLLLKIDTDSSNEHAIFKDSNEAEIFRIDSDATSLMMADSKSLRFRDFMASISSSAERTLDIQSGGGVEATITLSAYTPGTYSTDVLDSIHNDNLTGFPGGGTTTQKANRSAQGFSIGKFSYNVIAYNIIFDKDTASHASETIPLEGGGMVQVANVKVGIQGVTNNKQLADRIVAAVNAHPDSCPHPSSGDVSPLGKMSASFLSGTGNEEVVIRIRSTAESSYVDADYDIDGPALAFGALGGGLSFSFGSFAAANDGVINIGTDRGETITIGKAGTSTTVFGLSLANNLSVSGETASVTFNHTSPATIPTIKRNAAGKLLFTDADNTEVELTDLAASSVDATAFSTIGAPAGHERNVINTVRRLAIIGSGSVGGSHADDVYNWSGGAVDTGGGENVPSDIMFFVSGSIKPIGKNTPHPQDDNPGDPVESELYERRNVAFDSNLITSGSVFLRGLYNTNDDGEIIAGTGGSGAAQTFPHPVTSYDDAPVNGTGYVLSIDQTNSPGAAAENSLFGMASLHGHLRFSYSEPDVRIPAAGLSFTEANGANEVMVVKPTNGDHPAVIIPADKKLGFADASASYITSDGGSPNNVSVVAQGGLNLLGGAGSGEGVIIGSNWTASGEICADLGTVTTATIAGGTINGVTIGGSTPAEATFSLASVKSSDKDNPGAVRFYEGKDEPTHYIQVRSAPVPEGQSGLGGNTTLTLPTGTANGTGAAGTLATQAYANTAATNAATSAVTGAVTTVTSLKNNGLFVGRDGEATQIDLATANRIAFDVQTAEGATGERFVIGGTSVRSNVDFTVGTVSSGNQIQHVSDRITFTNEAPENFVQIDSTSVGTNGRNLSIQAGSTTADAALGAGDGNANKMGGNLNLISGAATGTGHSSIIFSTATGGSAGGDARDPAETMRIKGTKVGIGTNSPDKTLHVAGEVLITHGTSAQDTTPTLTLRTTGDGDNDGAVLRFDKNPTGDDFEIASGENLGEIYWYGAKGDGSAFYPGAAIVAEAAAEWNPGVEHKTNLKFGTTGDAGEPDPHMIILHDGRVGIGTLTPTEGKQLEVNGIVKATSFEGDITGDVTGNADTATKIASITNSDIVQLLAVQTLGNKTLTQPTIQQIAFDVDSIHNVPNVASDTFAVLSAAQTLSNKTLGATTISGNMIPDANNSYDLGSNTHRFANIYTNDLNLCNEGRGNDVDGTSGNWTIQEGKDNLYVINNLTGKKYKMALTPVEED